MQTFEQAQQYFAKVLPAPLGDAEPSYINLHWTKKAVIDGEEKTVWDGRACVGVDDTISTLKWISGLPDMHA